MFDRELLDRLVTDGWLRSARHPEADLWIYNYSERTAYENHWTPETLACRGLILDAAGNVVARPFGKFFNLGTEQAGPLIDEPFTATEKLDGSLGILYRVEGSFNIATRGSFTSEQAQVGTRMLAERTIGVADNTTPLFEIVYPANRIVVDYGGREDLILLACIDNTTGRDTDLPDYDGTVVDHLDSTDLDALMAQPQDNREGFVLSYASGKRIKVKFDEYVRLHRIVTGINARSVWESLRDGDDLEALLDGVPDEIHGWVDRCRDSLNEQYNAIEMQCAWVFDSRPGGADRRELAEFFKASDTNPAVLFRMLDGKQYDDLIWRSIKPAGDVRPESSWNAEAAA